MFFFWLCIHYAVIPENAAFRMSTKCVYKAVKYSVDTSLVKHGFPTLADARQGKNRGASRSPSGLQAALIKMSNYYINNDLRFDLVME